MTFRLFAKASKICTLLAVQTNLDHSNEWLAVEIRCYGNGKCLIVKILAIWGR